MSCGASWHRTSCHVGQVIIGQVGIGQIVLTPTDETNKTFTRKNITFFSPLIQGIHILDSIKCFKSRTSDN